MRTVIFETNGWVVELHCDLSGTSDIETQLLLTDPTGMYIPFKTILTLTPFILMVELMKGSLLTIRIGEHLKFPPNALES